MIHHKADQLQQDVIFHAGENSKHPREKKSSEQLWRDSFYTTITNIPVMHLEGRRRPTYREKVSRYAASKAYSNMRDPFRALLRTSDKGATWRGERETVP